MESKAWLKKAWVGHLQNLATFNRLEEELIWDGEEEIRPKYLGGDMVLLLKAETLCKE